MVKVICLPYAGGMASSYVKFKGLSNEKVEFILVELEGRGRRIGESLSNSIEEAAEDAYDQIKNIIRGNDDYALFGHSMGSWIAYELYYRIEAQNEKLPIHLFLSGNKSPLRGVEKKEISSLNDNDFIEYIVNTGHTSRMIFENKELRDVFLPVLRADYRNIENYYPSPSRNLINVNMTVLGGMSDNIVGGKLKTWGESVGQNCEYYYFRGGHFYLFDQVEDIVNTICQRIEICDNV